jgi:hypothetical protein
VKVSHGLISRIDVGNSGDLSHTHSTCSHPFYNMYGEGSLETMGYFDNLDNEF